MNKDNTYRFAMIFSGGKDSAIAKAFSPLWGIDEDTPELHTLAVDGPIFKHPLQYRIGKAYEGEKYSSIDIRSI